MKIRIMKWKEEKLAENFSHLMMKYLTLMVTIKMEAIDVQYLHYTLWHPATSIQI